MSSRKSAGNYALVLLGSAVLAFGIYNVHAQSGITEGGVLGAMLLLERWTGISPAISGAVMDVLCYLLGFRVLGRAFAKYSLVATAGFSAVYVVLEQFPPLLPALGGQPLLAAVLGGLFVGLGCGVIVRIGGAAGGDDALAMSISRLSGWPIARVYLITDAVILLASISYLPLGRIAWSLVTVTVSSCLIGFVQKAGLPKAPAAAEAAPHGAD